MYAIKTLLPQHHYLPELNADRIMHTVLAPGTLRYANRILRKVEQYRLIT